MKSGGQWDSQKAVAAELLIDYDWAGKFCALAIDFYTDIFSSGCPPDLAFVELLDLEAKYCVMMENRVFGKG